MNLLAAGAADGVDRLPGDQHGHDGGLAGAGGELQREAHQFGVGVLVGGGQMFEDAACRSCDCGATSVSQMAVSTASTWQKNGRTPLNLWCRQCWSSRAVSGVTCQSLGFGQAAPLVDLLRTSLMIEVGSYCCFSVESPLPSSKTKPCWAAPSLRFFGLGIGVMNSARRRFSMILWVGCPAHRAPSGAADTRKGS